MIVKKFITSNNQQLSSKAFVEETTQFKVGELKPSKLITRQIQKLGKLFASVPCISVI